MCVCACVLVCVCVCVFCLLSKTEADAEGVENDVEQNEAEKVFIRVSPSTYSELKKNLFV